VDRTDEDGAAAPLEDAPRASVVEMVAGQIRDAIDAGESWRPDYRELMRLTGRRRSWCEKVVRDARNLLLTPPGTGPDGDLAPDGEARTESQPGDRTDSTTGEARTGEQDRAQAPALSAA
jgi:hypothetical protein